MFSWKKWRERRRKRRSRKSSVASRIPEQDHIDHEHEETDEFLFFYRQFRRDKSALPDGWPSLEDSVSRDSGRSSGDITDDSPITRISPTPQASWTDRRHFFNRQIVDDSWDYGYLSSPQEEEEHDKEEEDSGVSSIATHDLHQRTVAPPVKPVLDVWDASQHLPITRRPQKKKVEPPWKWGILGPLVIISLATLIFIGWLLVSDPKCQCSETDARKLTVFDVKALANRLNESLFGQDLAVQQVLDFVHLAHHHIAQTSLISILFGDVGTGKTLAARLLQQSFLFPKNVFHLSPANWPELDDHLGNCFPFLILVENVEDIPQYILEPFMTKIMEAKTRLIVVFTSQTSELNAPLIKRLQRPGTYDRALNDIENFMAFLHDQGAEVPLGQVAFLPRTTLVPFLPLDRGHVKKCVRAQAQKMHVVFTAEEVRWILGQTDFFTPSFPVFSSDGCKSIARKANILMASRYEAPGIA